MLVSKEVVADAFSVVVVFAEADIVGLVKLFSVVVFAEAEADIVGLLKLFWRETRALVAEQSRGV